jgi:hypothetical protein
MAVAAPMTLPAPVTIATFGQKLLSIMRPPPFREHLTVKKAIFHAVARERPSAAVAILRVFLRMAKAVFHF